MGLLTFCLNVTLDGCTDHEVGVADEVTHAYFTNLMSSSGAMLWGRVTYELMEAYWPAVARGEIEATPALTEWARALETKTKYVVSSSRREYSWTNTHLMHGDLRESVLRLKEQTPEGVLLGSGALAVALDRLDLIDEYRFLVQPFIAGRGPKLFAGGLSQARALELISAEPFSNGVVAVHYRRVS